LKSEFARVVQAEQANQGCPTQKAALAFKPEPEGREIKVGPEEVACSVVEVDGRVEEPACWSEPARAGRLKNSG
jgi:hypothetical protein